MRSATLVMLAVLGLGCGTGTSTTPQIEPGDAEQPALAARKCKALDVDAALTTFEGQQCPWVLTRDDAVLELQSLDLDARPPYEGEMPPACTSIDCDWAGRSTTVGPLVLATQPSAASEMIAGAMLGFVGVDSRLTFVDLWEGAGEPVFDEGTELGPTHGLAPFDCGGKLGLFAVPRTEAGTTVRAAPTLRSREGIYTTTVLTPTTDRKRCEAIPWAMP